MKVVDASDGNASDLGRVHKYLALAYEEVGDIQTALATISKGILHEER